MEDTTHNLVGFENICAESPQNPPFVDIHCHCLAGVDDGPDTEGQSLALCQALAEDGIGRVIATPHQLGRFSDCNQPVEIRDAVSSLNRELRRHRIALSVVVGGDVRVDERLCAMLDADSILTLADGGRYLLLELPHEILIDIEPLLVDLSYRGIEAILSHPERHLVLARQPAILLHWLEHSVHLQVTAGSLLGEFGPLAERTAWQLLTRGWASLVATDAHGLHRRRPCMRTAFERIRLRLGERTARLVCIENPTRVLDGRPLKSIESARAGKPGNERVFSDS
jgi:protein-tyrosine phosphatase